MKSYQNDVEKSRPITENESSKQDSNDAFVVTNDYVLRVAFYSFLGFTILEATFAIRAKSTAMIADSVAMLVDVGTYLFNLLAELLKDRELTDHELQLSPIVQYHRRKLQRLYLELIPPMTSVCTLLVVTVFTIRCSIKTLSGLEPVDSDGPNLYVMMFFSVLNLLIDCINVSCFARINQTILCPKKFEEMPTYDQPMKETSLLLTDQTTASCTIENTSIVDDSILGDDDLSYEDDEKSVEGRNLNMCSAWTHVFADTLRTFAIFGAAGIANYTKDISATTADASAALLVSLIILFSCFPLMNGLKNTFLEIQVLKVSPFNRVESHEERQREYC